MKAVIKSPLGALRTTEQIKKELEIQQARLGFSSMAEVTRVALNYGISVLQQVNTEKIIKQAADDHF